MDLNQLVSLYRVERSSSSSDGTEATTSTTQPTPPSRGYHQPQPQIRTGYHDRRGFQQHQEWGARGRGSPRSTGSNYRMRGRGYRRGFSQQDREDQQATTRAMEQLMNTKLDTPEQIAAWIEERRRRFPTRANAERKRLLEEQDKRLELIKSIDNSTQPDLDSHSIDEHDIPQASALSSLSSSYNEEAISNASEDSTVESDGFDEEAPEELEFRSRLTKNASGNPAQTNDAHAFAADGVPLALEPVKASSQLAPTVLSLFDSGEKKPCKYFQKRGSCRFGARCSFMHVADPSRPLWRNTPKVAERPPSILQKILKDVIWKEEDLVLRCFDLFAKEAFFSHFKEDADDDDDEEEEEEDEGEESCKEEVPINDNGGGSVEGDDDDPKEKEDQTRHLLTFSDLPPDASS